MDPGEGAFDARELADERMPTWVKVGLALLTMALLALVVLHLTGNSPTGHTP